MDKAPAVGEFCQHCAKLWAATRLKKLGKLTIVAGMLDWVWDHTIVPYMVFGHFG